MTVNSILQEARVRTSELFGKAFSEKASDAFCLSVLRPTHAAGIESFGSPTPAAQAIVLEFAPDSTGLRQIAAELRATETWSRLSDVASTLRPLAESIAIGPADLLRPSLLGAIRDSFSRVAGPITTEIERGARGFFRPGPEAAGSSTMPSSVTETCWLNRTVRTWVDPRALAEVASDRSITTIDLPRRLEAELDRSAPQIGAPQYRSRSGRTGRGVIVAVIDSEIAFQHPAFEGRVVQKSNLSRELWGNPDVHGTAVAGIIGANGADIQGMAPGATIYNYKVLATNRFLNGEDFDGVLAIQQALADGAHIANCSWGMGPASNGTSREARACNAAWSFGLAVVKSAGNAGPGANTLTSPADADGIIVVGATDHSGSTVQTYSSRGRMTSGETRPHLVAPGGGADFEEIVSCIVAGGFGNCSYGTSYAAPHVSGIAALLLEAEPNLTPDELRQRVLGLCTPLPGADAEAQGAGRISLMGL